MDNAGQIMVGLGMLAFLMLAWASRRFGKGIEDIAKLHNTPAIQPPYHVIKVEIFLKDRIEPVTIRVFRNADDSDTIFELLDKANLINCSDDGFFYYQDDHSDQIYNFRNSSITGFVVNHSTINT